MDHSKGYVYELMDKGGPTDNREPYFAEAVDEIRAYEEKKEPDIMPEYTDANGNINAKPKLMYADDFDGYIRETFGEDGDFCAYTFDGKYYI